MRPLPSIEFAASRTRSLRDVAERLLHETGGATALEYSLLSAIMAAAVVACMSIFSTAMKGMFDTIVGYYTLAQ